ncbi:MAG TPA: allophanate hydrolase subunit 1 [Jatrophihabitans sp.]|nr:allophanate hydrolase subunit 1 [Jatrophihabitans sp.]
MRILHYGDEALLVELDDPERVLPLATAARGEPGALEVVPAARSVLVRAARESQPSLIARLTELAQQPTSPAEVGDEVVVDISYDGPDLADTAVLLGMSPQSLVRRHAEGSYVVAFCGFAPGFAYLRGLDSALHAPRLPEPRTRVPAGAVGIAGEFTGIYPRESPGGWRLLGRTDAILWDLERDPPALLVPGTRVRFRAATPT